jgi:indolepyruvate ferredoxin oxidoreductase, beta subunit
MTEQRSLNIIVAALGGEGGGVLSDWLIAAASLVGLPVQSTSIPGVAQRTGATTYYLEIFPHKPDGAGQRPILALTPTPADVDVVAASELVEAGRALQNGYVTPQRTTLIASTNRVFAIGEKSAMADGRFAAEHIVEAAQKLARRAILFDMAAVAQSAAAPINAVLFGALIGSGALPIARATAEEAIRQTGKSVDVNLWGFVAGFDRGQQPATPHPQNVGWAKSLAQRLTGGHGASAILPTRKGQRSAPLPNLLARSRTMFPPAAHEVIALGIERLVDYQGVRYADLFLQQLVPIARAEERARNPDFTVTQETARLLALWMSYEDVIRVADLKTRADRTARIREETRARPGDIVQVTDFLKPGIDELCSILPPRLGRALMKTARDRGLEDRLNVGMYIRSTSAFGFLLLRLLAGLRWWRPRSLRYHDEQQLIERWLAAVERAAATDLELAREIAECAQLVKGYGDTHRRGVTNFALIERAYFDGECGPSNGGTLADAVRGAREAALADPEGIALQSAIERSLATNATSHTPRQVASVH